VKISFFARINYSKPILSHKQLKQGSEDIIKKSSFPQEHLMTYYPSSNLRGFIDDSTRVVLL